MGPVGQDIALEYLGDLQLLMQSVRIGRGKIGYQLAKEVLRDRSRGLAGSVVGQVRDRIPECQARKATASPFVIIASVWAGESPGDGCARTWAAS